MTDGSTRARDISGILEASQVTGCDNLLVIAKEEECMIEIGGKRILVLPAWKWLFTPVE